MSKYKVEISGIDTSSIAVLSNEEMNQLFVRMKQGDSEARNLLVEGNLKLVLSILKRFHHRTDNMDDLFQIGCVGLVKAIDNFNTELDVRFSTYAVPMIIGEVRRYLRDNNAIRVSRSLRDLAYKALSVREKLLKTESGEPSVTKICAELEKEGVKCEPSEVAEALEAIVVPVSLFDPVYSDGSSDCIYVMDQIKDESNTEEKCLEELALHESFKKLSEREKGILELRFYRGKTQMEIADEIGISQAQVSRLEKSALQRMKKDMT